MSQIAHAEQPGLPLGLAGNEPVLPAGLESSELGLANGLAGQHSGSNRAVGSKSETPDYLSLDLSAFAETRLGRRLHNDPNQKKTSIGEGRVHLEAIIASKSITGTLSVDTVWDPVSDQHSIDLERGNGWLDLREANVLFSPTEYGDVKIGRQILTWGTGDLLFINDLFPKDWNSFFIGRDEEYLKGPSDAIKLALYSDLINLDIAYTPQFDADRFIDGRRISYFDAGRGVVVGRDNPLRTQNRGAWFDEDEIALRLHRLIGTYEAAAYFYYGYWKSPAGQDAGSGLYTFPGLSVYGASLRGPLGSGILSGEVGYYHSRDDEDGSNGFINNSEWRFLMGYEQELWPEMTANVQYYQEWLQDYDAYVGSVPSSTSARYEHRHLFTLRFTQLLMNQNLQLSTFIFYSPTEKDVYLRPNISYKPDDHWVVSMGGNIFSGQQQHTFFGQFEDSSNVYASLRYGF